MTKPILCNKEVCDYTIGELDSDLITEVGYCTAANSLWVQLIDGTVYRYANVPERVVDDLRHADSMGTFFNQYIRDDYEFESYEFA